MFRKIKNRYNNSIQTKLMVAFLLTTVIIMFMNMFMYVNTNRMLASLDEVYAENINLNTISDTLDSVDAALTGYLNTRSFAYMEDYYRYAQDYTNLTNELYGDISSNKLLLMERDIKNMSENYITLTNYAVDGKRGGNIEKYKVRYEEAGKLYTYLKYTISELNNERFRRNAEIYQLQSANLRALELMNIISIFIIGIMNVFMIIILTNSITKPLIRLADAAGVVSEGNLNIDMVPIEAEDEIGVVTKAFNQMLENIRLYIERLRENMETERQHKEKELLMESHLKDAQLKYLQAQINPHFLFNTLNAGAQLAMMEGADRTYTYVQRVADFFRYNIKKDQDEVTLREEIALVDTYVYILNVRFAGDIHYSKEIDESLLDVKIPGMTLQPIVENSVNYGIRNIDWEGEIKLKVYKQDDTVCISIKDNGVGIPEDKLKKIISGEFHADEGLSDSNGVGLDNVINRLKIYLGEDDVIDIISEGENKGTETIIYVQNSIS
ncbi:MAG: histidine kinase [Lachnospiraceae bacterium]|nr:histidine kinase [Lachnospiraceae bacterium]